MLAGARARAAELEMTNLEFKVFGGEWIDLPVASVDAILCRFGYMLMTDPLAALTETRRVLRPGGRVALAVWDAPERNPWALLASMELIERGISTAPVKDNDHFQPGPFALSDPEHVRSLLEQAGFTDVHLDKLDLEQRHASFEDFWETMLDISRSFHDLVLDRPEHEITEIREGVASRLAPFTSSDGSLQIPGRTIVGLASA
jgi:ubiquinone/menaquinone biosynthesis C-methylase UbiE